MDMLEKRFVSGNVHRAVTFQSRFGLAQYQLRRRGPFRNVSNDRVDARVGPERQGVGIARELKMLARGGIRGAQQRVSPPELEFGKFGGP